MSNHNRRQIEMWSKNSQDKMLQIDVRLFNGYDLTAQEKRQFLGNAVDQIMLTFSATFPVHKMRVRTPREN